MSIALQRKAREAGRPAMRRDVAVPGRPRGPQCPPLHPPLRPPLRGMPTGSPRARTGEPRRPPTRARVVAGRRPGGGGTCRPRRIPPRWPALGALAAAVFLGVLGLGLFAGALADSGAAEVPPGTAVVSVRAGDSLWEVARRAVPGGEPAAVVERIRELNGLTGLTGGSLDPGSPLVVPAGS